MPAATLQLVSYGAQDMYLTGNPQITYFKVVYRRHTNFSMEDIVIDTINKNTIGYDNTHTLLLPKIGDLFHKLILMFKGNKVFQGNFLANPTTALINDIRMMVDGHQIDKLFGHWIETWYELTKPNHNGTCTNLTYMNDHSLTHLSSSMDLALCHYDRHSIGNTLVSLKDAGINGSISVALSPDNASNIAVFLNEDDHHHTYYNSRLNKLTNIMGLGLSYPPTQFQKMSKCGGVFCSPTFLIDNYDEGNANGSLTDYAITDLSYIGGEANDFSEGLKGMISASSTRMGDDENGIVRSTTRKNTSNLGSILGNCTLDIPFYFSKDPGLSIPIVALQNSNIQFSITFVNNSEKNYFNNDIKLGSGTDARLFYSHNGTSSNMNNCYNAHVELESLFKNDNFNFDIDIIGLFIYLDTDEKRRFAQVSHEYLIEQVQCLPHRGNSVNHPDKINISSFTHPVKEIIWIGSPFKMGDVSGSLTNTGADITQINNGKKAHNSGVRFCYGNDVNIPGGSIKNKYSVPFGNASDSGVDPKRADDNTSFSNNGIFKSGLLGPSTPSCLDECNWSIEFNSQNRIGPHNLQYYTRTQVERYHSGHGSVSCPDSIAVYSFALSPEKHQPSGTCNFSKIDVAHLVRDTVYSPSYSQSINVYAINYNILRFMGGLCSLAYNL